MLSARQSTILHSLVQQYIASADPVASGRLASQFNLSPATIRNEMNELERQGYIFQPHTSAGRVPTEAGFKLYLSKSDNEKKTSLKDREVLQSVWSNSDSIYSIKLLSKKLAELSGEAVVVAFSTNDIFYTGISNLLSKPEFGNLDLLVNLTKLIDHLDEVVAKIFDKVAGNAQIWIGRENPFSRHCGTIIASYKRPDHKGMIAMIGPMRMDYQDNLGLINLCKSIIEDK